MEVWPKPERSYNVSYPVIQNISLHWLLTLQNLLDSKYCLTDKFLVVKSNNGYNIVAASTPNQYSGIAYGMTVLFFYLGMAMGPTIAGLYMQTQQVSVSNAIVNGSFPSPEAYNMIFLTAAIISLTTIGLTIFLKKK